MSELSAAWAADSIWPPETILAEEILEATLDLVISLVTYTLKVADGVSISLVCRHDGEFHTPRATSAEVAELDGIQYETGQGPCVQAIHTGRPVNISIASEGGRWPEFTRQAKARELRSVLAMPLLRSERVLGALNVYSQRPVFREYDQGLVGQFARHAAVVLSNASEFITKDWLDQQVVEALSRADMIGQAKGILIAKGYTPDEAMATLHRASDRANRELSEVAQDMVTSSRRARPS